MIRVARKVWVVLTDEVQEMVAAMSNPGAVLVACAVMFLIAMIGSVVA